MNENVAGHADGLLPILPEVVGKETIRRSRLCRGDTLTFRKWAQLITAAGVLALLPSCIAQGWAPDPVTDALLWLGALCASAWIAFHFAYFLRFIVRKGNKTYLLVTKKMLGSEYRDTTTGGPL